MKFHRFRALTGYGLSLPSRERGLKLTGDENSADQMASLPSRERGLKLSSCGAIPTASRSLPSRERGLKYSERFESRRGRYVAPFAGAWIEIRLIADRVYFVNVAPFAGAWIEISLLIAILGCSVSRSLRGSVD